MSSCLCRKTSRISSAETGPILSDSTPVTGEVLAWKRSKPKRQCRLPQRFRESVSKLDLWRRSKTTAVQVSLEQRLLDGLNPVVSMGTASGPRPCTRSRRRLSKLRGMGGRAPAGPEIEASQPLTGPGKGRGCRRPQRAWARAVQISDGGKPNLDRPGPPPAAPLVASPCDRAACKPQS
jgi:hypothetical protein